MNLSLPGASNQLVEALLKATSNVVVVTQSGLPITMPWIDQAPTIVHVSHVATFCPEYRRMQEHC